MNIPYDKQIIFLTRILEDTKSHVGIWNRLPSTCQAAYETFPNDKLDVEGVFSYMFPKGIEGEFLIARRDDGEVIGAIGTNYDQMVPLQSGNKRISVLLTQIFYLIFDSRPNANKLIDSFLSLEKDRDSADSTP